MECVDFVEKHIPVGQFQWFIDIFSYLQFFHYLQPCGDGIKRNRGEGRVQGGLGSLKRDGIAY